MNRKPRRQKTKKRRRRATPKGKFHAASVSPLSDALERFQKGRLIEAEDLARRFIGDNPGHVEALHLLGLIAFQQGRAAEAAVLIREAVDGGSDNPAHHANLGFALKTAGRLDEAIEAYRRALELAPGDANIWNDYANTVADSGRPGEALEAYHRAISLNARDPKAHVNLASALLALGRAGEAEAASRKAVELAPRLAEAHNGLASALTALGRIDEAARTYQIALDLDPDDAKIIANLAALHEESNRPEKARATAEKALAIEPGNPHAQLLLAKCDRREGNIRAAIARLEGLDGDRLPSTFRRDACFELARLYDRENEAAKAFGAMAEGNRLTLSLAGGDDSVGDPFLESVEGLHQRFTKDWVASWRRVPEPSPGDGDGYADPVFLVGFPRSGTTLLGHILDAHPRLRVYEELALLEPLIDELRDNRGGYPEGLADLDGDDIGGLREKYFEAVAAAGEHREEARIVDKFPLHMVHAGAITRLFPAARMVLVLRHPLDVCLSCFMQNFKLNAAMANFLSIEHTARAYARVMGLWRHYRAVVDPSVHVIRYEDVIEDFDGAVGALLDFLGLQWHDAVRDYAERARRRGRINTPSYQQVTEKIYTRARYRWRRYEKELAPVMATLEPFIEAFGYGAGTEGWSASGTGGCTSTP